MIMQTNESTWVVQLVWNRIHTHFVYDKDTLAAGRLVLGRLIRRGTYPFYLMRTFRR